MQKYFFITTPIYYINATPHIGHAYTQIAADARARFERLQGKPVYFLTGTDENAEKIARVARAAGRDVQEFCDELAEKFRQVWDDMGISYDEYIRTSSAAHKTVVQGAIERLWQSGHLKTGTYTGWYSVPDETFFREEDTEERDGHHYIKNPTEDLSKAPLEWVEEVTHYFELSKFAPWLLDYYDKHPEVLLPQTRRNETLAYIKSGLHDTSISREMDWGVSVPASVPHHENHVVYVWFDALMNYFSAPGYLSKDAEKREFFEQIWPPDLQLMAKDIFTRFHATLWPALLHALDLPLPKQLFAHGFWTVNGRKMSKRDPETIIEPIAFSRHISRLAGCDLKTAIDALRYYSLREVTFGSDGDFSPEGCLLRYNSDLANGWGNLVQRTLSMLHQYFEGTVSVAEGEFGLRKILQEKHQLVYDAYGQLDFSAALTHVWQVIAEANRTIEEQKPWVKIKAGDEKTVAGLIGELLLVCRWTAMALTPVMPHVGERLWKMLNVYGDVRWLPEEEMLQAFPLGHRCYAPEPLFNRIKNIQEVSFMPEQDTPITENTNTTENAAENVAAEVEKAEPEYIEYDDFAKVQLRSGKVLSAERIPKADKLLLLKVDVGSETRQILAGLAQQFEPESLVGKTVIVVVNLKPRKLRGYESQGMLLAASPSDDAPPSGLLTVDADVIPGSIVR